MFLKSLTFLPKFFPWRNQRFYIFLFFGFCVFGFDGKLDEGCEDSATSANSSVSMFSSLTDISINVNLLVGFDILHKQLGKPSFTVIVYSSKVFWKKIWIDVKKSLGNTKLLLFSKMTMFTISNAFWYFSDSLFNTIKSFLQT